MSYSKKSDFTIFEDDDLEFGPLDTIDLDDYPDDSNEVINIPPIPGLREVPSNASLTSSDSSYARKYSRSASISVASEPLSTGLSFILDMDKEEALEHSQSLHDDIEKMFDKSPQITLSELISSGADGLTSERGNEGNDIPIQTDRYLDERDISSHRRASFPHIHVPLKSLHSHSLKNFGSLLEIDKDEEEPKIDVKPEGEKKKKRRKKKSKAKVAKKTKSSIFPSKSALLSPAIPEVENEEYSDSEESSNEDDQDDDDESTKLLGDHDQTDSKTQHHRPSASEPVRILSRRPSPSPSQMSDVSFKPGGLFYIGGSEQHIEGSSPPNQVQPSVPSSSVGSDMSMTQKIGPTGTSPVVVILDDDSSQPLISTSLRQATKDNTTLVMGSDGNNAELEHPDASKVKFLLGEYKDDDQDDTGSEKTEDQSDESEEEKDENQTEENEDDEEPVWKTFDEIGQNSPHPPSPLTSPKPSRSHKHRRHHQNYKVEDLMSRRQRGSEVHLEDSLKRVPTETDEAMLLQSVDLDEMASHRMENLHGMRKHKIGRKKHKTVSSVVYIGKSDKAKRKYFNKPSKKVYDHSPHEVFVELDELYTGENYDVEWREKARWIKFEEDVEEGAERWGKPHVASLSFHSLLELRKGLETGSLMLDLEASDLITIVQRVVENMVIHDQVPSEAKGQVMRTLLTKHKFIDEEPVKTILRRHSTFNLLGLEQQPDRHQRDQLSLMKTLSSASFANIPSSANLKDMGHQHHSNNMNNSINHNNQNMNGQGQKSQLTVPVNNGQRSHSCPESNRDHEVHFNSILEKNLKNDFEKKNLKNEAKKKEKKKKPEPGRVEFVKVDVDNNTELRDGVHIGLVPQESDTKGRPDQKGSLMRRISRDAEACTVLVGCVDYLKKPAMAFVRLAERQVLDNLTEVPLPVRFVFILLGPDDSSLDYHEIGRSISTLMSNQHFHEIAYRAESRSEILHAINEFLNESIVLPPGDWDQKTLLPVMDMARKRAKIRRKKIKKKEEFEALLKKEEVYKIPMDPLKRTGRLFGGVINDVKRRFPHYYSDFKDAMNFQCVMALIFIFFACFAPCIAFGGLIGEKTYGKIGVTETIMSTAITNVVFGFFSAQPIILYGATGPVLVFEKHLYGFCKTSHIDFMTWRVWIGFWVFVITLIVLAFEGSFIVRYITRFTEEVFAILISLIFIFEVIHKLQEIYEEHPLRNKKFYCDNSTQVDPYHNGTDDGNYTNINASMYTSTTAATTSVLTVLHNISTVMNNSVLYNVVGGGGGAGPTKGHGTTAGYGEGDTGYIHGMKKYDKEHNEPNTALLSTILILGTFLIAYFLRIFRNSKFLGRSARRALGDFGIITAIVLMVLFDYLCDDIYTQKLNLPLAFKHTDSSLKQWLVNPFGDETHKMEVWLMFMAIIPAFLIFLLLFLECQLTEMLLHKEEFKLHKGSGFHLDQGILGLMTFLLSLFGLPWMCPATVRSVAHVSALAVMSRTHAPGEKPKLLGVKDQRVTNIVMNLLIGSSLLWGPVLHAVPMAVLFGVFLYLGVSAISGVQLYKRIKLLFMPVKHHPGKSYVRRVRTFKMHLFTIIQLVLVAILWVVKSTIAAIAFPLLVFSMVPFRLKVMPKIFTKEELEVLDKEEEDSDDEEDDDPDFYQLAHMPV